MNPSVDERVLPELKLPRKLEEEPRAEEITALLRSNRQLLWEKSPYRIAELPWALDVEERLGFALQARKLEIGIENIEKFLDREKRGLDAVHAKAGSKPALRISRLLIVAKDGSERLFRSCESLLTRHGDRLLMIRFDVPAATMGEKIFGPDRGIKVLLVADREQVEGVLLSLGGEAPTE